MEIATSLGLSSFQEHAVESKQEITVSQRLSKSILVGTIMVVIGFLCGFC